MRKLLAAMLAATMMFGLVSCSSGTTASTDTDSGSSTGGAESGSTTSEPSADGLNIAIVTSPNTVDDGSFNEDNYNGALAFLASRNNIDKLTPVQEVTGDTTAAVTAVEAVVADYDVLLCVGYQFAGIATVAEENPDKMFVLVDSFPTDANYSTVEVDNIYAMTFAEQESGFFAGVSAALETQTGKVAVVNGIAYPSNVNYQFGFESGVNYAVANLGATAEIVELASYAGTDVTGTDVGGNYIGDFVDEAKGKTLGQALIAEGVDIIFVAAGGAGNGVFTAIKESAATDYVIGCDVDQYDDGANGSENIILTSVLKNMAVNIERQLNAVADGTFAGGNVNLYADTDSTGYVSQDGRQQLSDSTLSALADLYPLVKDQTIQPAANFSGTTPEEFPGL